ncbi:FecR domain-containing protein [Pseudomonas donghuensis]|uniref:FecR family protein n=1 Tax=Pseudomonas donghuensis TaxID=1163398 RepID=A0AAP0SJ61_9PSED|nr:FecR family protein [Pseudomonas donghuensis]MDF9895753.1 transmembrane sensor [Pseudomonas vranovensis]KDO00312.1 FecR family protein [Pseudomonas donghuensis]MBF4209915.1 FecR family protein [Pseudomonas donghuensis]MCP6689881.1 FecR family protein [Pseudomonas donghuensis]PJY94167.1 amino acid ABC transporter substrate-binding protein [Pseudomonas donghuensis]
MNNKPVSARVLDAAIAWQLCLDSGTGNADERAEFARWHAANEEHARAWMQLGMLDQRFSAAAGPARQALLQSRAGLRQRVRKLGGGLASLMLVVGLLSWVNAHQSLGYWLADQRTGTGEQRTLRLTDGTLISLNTHSAVDIRFDEKQRLIVLHEGEISIETGHKDDRPFVVSTEDGRMRALGTRFLVKLEGQGTRLSVLQSAVAARPQDSGDEQILKEGQQVLMSHDRLGRIDSLAAGADAWTRGMLVVDNVRLADLIDELGRYRSGHLGVAADVADLRITGSFPLNNTDLALTSLLPTLPVQIEQRTPWWVTVVAKRDTH